MKRSKVPCGWSILLLLVGLLVVPAESAAVEQGGWGEGGRIYAVQKKAYRLKHELHAALGVLPMDSMYKGITFGAGYTYHFSHQFGWEVVQVLLSQNVDTGLKDDLQDIFSVEPSNFREVKFMANSNFVFVPLYGKMSWLNSKVVEMECYLTGGPGIARYKEYEREGAEGYDKKNKYYFSANFGVGLRLFFNKKFSARLDLRDYMNFVDGIDNVAYFGLAMSWNFRLPKFAEEADEE